jgi:hypothetical protein
MNKKIHSVCPKKISKQNVSLKICFIVILLRGIFYFAYFKKFLESVCKLVIGLFCIFFGFDHRLKFTVFLGVFLVRFLTFLSFQLFLESVNNLVKGLFSNFFFFFFFTTG